MIKFFIPVFGLVVLVAVAVNSSPTGQKSFEAENSEQFNIFSDSEEPAERQKRDASSPMEKSMIAMSDAVQGISKMMQTGAKTMQDAWGMYGKDIMTMFTQPAVLGMMKNIMPQIGQIPPIAG